MFDSVPTPSNPDEWSACFLAHDTPVSMVAGQIVAVNLRVQNVGSRTWQQGGSNPVHVGYKWFNTTGQPQMDMETRRTALPSDIAQNQETALGAILIAPKTPGTYTLRWDLVAEGMTWFADAGNPPLVVPVFVTAVPRDVTGWRVESSINPAEVALALDGDPGTFWDSGTPQAAEQWFRLNLSESRLIDGIQFLSPGKGFPAGYVLRVSANGTAWLEIARVPANNHHDVMAVFAPQQLQYAQIDLLTPPPSSDAGVRTWMISQILVHPATQWVANASHNSTVAGHAIDNRADTAWSSRTPQTPGMWFQIDLGCIETVSGIMLIPPADEAPVAFRITTWNAGARRWQVAYEKKDNHAQVDAVFAATQTQFINLQLLAPCPLPWAIQHVRVIREVDNWLGS